MVRKLLKYECEMCKQLYDSLEDALECEAQGKELPLANVMDEVLYRDDWNGGFGVSFDKMFVTEIKDYGHYIGYALGSEDGYPYESVFGNDKFEDKCGNTNK